MKTNYVKLIVSTFVLASAFNAIANVNVGGIVGTPPPTPHDVRSVNAQCQNATQQIDLDINNVRAKIMNGGDMWWDIFGSGDAAYQVPNKHNGSYAPSSQFASSVWVGGYDAGGVLKEAAQTYRQTGNDYWPGPLMDDATTNAGRCLDWDKFWKINREDVIKYYAWCSTGQIGVNPILSSSTQPNPMDQINTWPWLSPEGHPMAPYYDANGDGVYDPSTCDVPDFDVDGTRGCNAQLFGDQCVFWVFNDKGNIHTESGGEAIGMEIQAQAFAFKTNDEINNATFYKYKLINKSSFRLDSTFFGVWDDADLGWYKDDYVGCDVSLGLGMLFNGVSVDGTGQAAAYGVNPPAIGIDFFEGPYKDANGIDDNPNLVPPSFTNYGNATSPTDTAHIDDERLGLCKFMYFNNNNDPVNGNPAPGDDIYQYLSGTWKNATPITYGGDGTTGSILCDYMFPGTSDALHYFGTDGVVVPAWDETTSGNVPDDRRFVESSGPFTLQPGAVNTITIGVPWARATQGGNLASVSLLKSADAKAQKLFNNCFSTLNGPDAPTLNIQEIDKQLILTWSNPKTSNNYNEVYSEDYDHSTGTDSLYRFQGYMVYQLLDATVSQTELYNPDRARLIAQCDKKDKDNPNGAFQIINYNYDVTLSALVPQEMVYGEDKGIFHSLKVTTDKFATGDDKLINHKNYYFAIIAYGYTPTQTPTALLQDYLPFIAGRRFSDGLFVHTGIPHIPSSEAYGTVQQSSYGSGPKLTRVEGQGNGGNVLDLTSASIETIMSSSSGYRIVNPQYENGHGPATIQVVDPLNVPVDQNFRLIIYDDNSASGSTITTKSKWDLINLSTSDTVHSETSIELPNEQIINAQPSGSATFSIPKWGLSVNIVYTYNPGDAAATDNSFLEGTISFANSSMQWLTGLADEEGLSYHNWIRSGTFTAPTGFVTFSDDKFTKDDEGVYEKVLDGTWAPYRLTASTKVVTGGDLQYIGGPGWDNSTAWAKNNMKFISSVDVVITTDKSKWTRCPVLELQEVTAHAQGGATKLMMRKAASVDRNGLDSTKSGFNSTDGFLNGHDGMGWFPGYAINQETGERLNMAFGEDSWLSDDHGRDMIWNPTETEDGLDGTPVFGGKHYIYVFGHNGEGKFPATDAKLPNYPNDCPRYDEGAWMHAVLNAAATSSGTATTTYRQEFFADAMWVGIPLLNPGHSLMETDVKIRLRVAKSYNRGYTETQIGATQVNDTSLNPLNKNLPVYDFSTADIGTRLTNGDAASSALDLINVVPNPYYAYSGYEMKTGDNIVKITNLPEKCTVTIFSINGTLVRTFDVAQPGEARNTMGVAVTSVNWDLKNQDRIPVASGMYLIHIEVPDVGEKTLKWFGVLRPLDLDAY